MSVFTRMLTSLLVFSRNAGCFCHVTGGHVGTETKQSVSIEIIFALICRRLMRSHTKSGSRFLPGTRALLRHTNMAAVSLREKRSLQISCFDWRPNNSRSSLEIFKLSHYIFFLRNSYARRSICGTQQPRK